MRNITHEEFKRQIEMLGFRAVGSPAYGWNEKSIGSEVEDGNGQRFWIKMISAQSDQAKGREWDGEKMAAHWAVDWKPKIHRVHDQGDSLRTQLIVSEKIRGSVLGVSQHEITPGIEINERFLVHLRKALAALKCVTTDRVNTRFDLVQRRINERWDLKVEYADCTWETIHGDLHWQNLSGPELEIIDWEGWGIGLLHQDLAFLTAFSGLYGTLGELIWNVFQNSVSRRDLSLAQLFATAELLRMAENFGDHPELVPSLEALGERAKNDWLA